MTNSAIPTDGHRARLRQRFSADGASMADCALLELVLAFAIPRRDVSPMARSLLDRFGSLQDVFAASPAALMQVEGVGEQTSVLLGVIREIAGRIEPITESGLQPLLLDAPEQARPEMAAAPAASSFGEEFDDGDGEALFELGHYLRAFVNDEIVNALQFLPEARRFATLKEFRAYLRQRLPYNSATTRQRRATYIVDRFFLEQRGAPEEPLDSPLIHFLNESMPGASHQSAVFYHTLRAELLAARVAEELVWPALPRGSVTRVEMRTFVLQQMPDLSKSSQVNCLKALFNTYSLCGVARVQGDRLRVQTHAGDLDSFVYILSAEFPAPGMHRFEAMEQGAMGKWLLWDREWMRRQLYALRDVGVIAKVSEIDAIRQFTLRFDQRATLRQYFALDRRDLVALREESRQELDSSRNADLP